MPDPYVGEIRIFAFQFVPTGWAACNGQLLVKNQNTALFSIIGTTYGGDGVNNFALPDLRERIPMRHGQGPGLAERFQGESGGDPAVTLLESEIPAHSHQLFTEGVPAVATQPGGRVLAQGDGIGLYDTDAQPVTSAAAEALAPAGGSLPHENLMPYLTLQFCIALQGIFPSPGSF